MSRRASCLLALAAGAALPAAAQERLTQRVDTHASYSALSAGAGAWREASATYSAEVSHGSIAAVQVETHERFGIEEQFAELRFSQRLDAGVLNLSAGGAGKGIFKPRLSLRADYETDVGAADGGWTFLAGGGGSWFDGNEALALKLGVGKRLTADGWAARAQLVATRDRGGAAPLGYSLGISGPILPNVSLNVGFADVAEPEHLQVVEVEAWSASLVFEIDDHWQCRFGGTHEERGAYRRDEIGIGAARRF